jgi:hypothetical protein
MKGFLLASDIAAASTSISDEPHQTRSNIDQLDQPAIQRITGDRTEELDTLLDIEGREPASFLHAFGTPESALLHGTESQATTPADSEEIDAHSGIATAASVKEAGLECECDHHEHHEEPDRGRHLKRVPSKTAKDLEETDNCCGQVAIGTALSAFGQSASSSELSAMNPAGIFTAPGAIVEFLNPRIGARQRNGGTVEDLREALDKGSPVIVLVNNEGTPHWITVTGYQLNASGEVSHLEIRDQCIASGSCDLLGVSEFERIWNSPLAGMHDIIPAVTDYSNLWIETGTGSNIITGHSFSTAAEDLGASAINRLVRGWKNGNWTEILHGLSEGISAVPSLLLSAGGTALESGGDTLASLGAEQFRSGGLYNWCMGGAKWLAGKSASYTGKGLDLIGDCTATVGRVISSGVRATGEAVKTVGRAVGNGFRAAANWIGSWF